MSCKTFVLVLFLLSTHCLSSARQSFSGLFDQSSATHVYLYDISWEELRNRHQKLSLDGFELLDVEAATNNGKTGFWAIWRESGQTSRLERAANWDELLRLRRELAAQGWRLNDVESYRDHQGKTFFLGLWLADKAESRIIKAESWESLIKHTDLLANEYFFLTDVEAMNAGQGELHFLAVFRKAPPTERAFLALYDDQAAFQKNRLQRQKSGYPLIDYETFEQDDKEYYLGLYKKAPKTFELCHRLDWTSMVAYQQYLGDDYSLVDLEISFGAARIVAPPVLTERLETMPNISQALLADMVRSAGLADQSAPCAAANGLLWLARNGYPRLNPLGKTDGPSAPELLVRKLADGEHMRTLRPGEEANVYSVIDGLTRYIEAQRYELAAVEVQGIRGFDARQLQFHAARAALRAPEQVHTLSLEFARKGMIGPSIVLLQWGIYEPEAGDSLHVRFVKVGDRWATLAGYGLNEYQVENKRALIAHSPAHGGETPLYLIAVDLDERVRLGKNAVLINPGASEDQAVSAAGKTWLKNALTQERDRFAVWESTVVVRLKEPGGMALK
jgi:hypothetical protein